MDARASTAAAQLKATTSTGMDAACSRCLADFEAPTFPSSWRCHVTMFACGGDMVPMGTWVILATAMLVLPLVENWANILGH
jgi:hypothetical protein